MAVVVAVVDEHVPLTIHSGMLFAEGHIYRSVDSGVTWIEEIVGGAIRNFRKVAGSRDGVNLLAMVSASSPSGAWRSTDRSFLSLFYSLVRACTQYALTRTRAARTHALEHAPTHMFLCSGNTWVNTGSPTYAFDCVACNGNDGLTCIAGVHNGAFYRTTNHGASWTNIMVGNLPALPKLFHPKAALVHTQNEPHNNRRGCIGVMLRP